MICPICENEMELHSYQTPATQSGGFIVDGSSGKIWVCPKCDNQEEDIE